MRDTVPTPDPDDHAMCGCGKSVRGVSARRFFRRHVASCRGWAELRYGETTRIIGPIDRAVFASSAARRATNPVDAVGRITPPTQEQP